MPPRRPAIRKRVRTNTSVDIIKPIRVNEDLPKRFRQMPLLLEPINKGRMITLNFTTTAMARPDIVERTYQSFKDNLSNVDFANSSLYINIEPIPVDVNRDDVVEVAKRYFGEVIVNKPDVPNFTAAVKWCWENATGDYFFHLEDDWIMIRSTDINDLIRIMKPRRNVSMVNLRANKGIRDGRVCLSPGLVNNFWAKQTVRLLELDYNPEKQMRQKSKKNPHGGKSPYGYNSIQYPKNSEYVVLQDIGREWLEKTRYRRPDGNDFVVWTER